MKKMMMTLAAVLCCAMFVTVSMTSCTNDIGDNPVIIPMPDTPDPLLNWGCSLADVEQHMMNKQWWADGNEQPELWEDPFQSWHKWYWVSETLTEQYLFETQDGQNLRYVVCYNWDDNGTKETYVKLLNQQGFQSTGKIFYETCELYLSADGKTEAQLDVDDEGHWYVIYMPYAPESVTMADVLKVYTAPQSLYKLDTKELLPIYVVVNSAYENELGDTRFYDLSTITSVSCLSKEQEDMFTIDATQLADHGYIKLTPNMENQEIQFMVEDMELAQMEGSLSYPLVLTNSNGEKLQADLMLTYVYPTEVSLKKEITLADLDENNKYTIDLPEELKCYKLNEWPFNRTGDAIFSDMGYFFDAEVVDNKLIVTTDGRPTDPGDPDKLTYTFTRNLTGSPYPMLPEGDGLMVNYRIELELIVNP